MERLWVTLVAVGATLFSFGVDGSVLHAIAAGPGYVQLIPQSLLYTNLHQPAILSQLHHGLRVDEALGLPRNEHEQSVIAKNDEIGEQARNAEELLHTPTSESPKENINNLITKEQEQQYIQLFQDQLRAVEGNKQELLPAPISESSNEDVNNLINHEQEQLYIQLLQGQPQAVEGTKGELLHTPISESSKESVNKLTTHEQEQLYVQLLQGQPQAVEGTKGELLHTPISETSKESVNKLTTQEQEQLYVQLFQPHIQPAEGPNEAERTLTSSSSAPTSLLAVEPLAQAPISTAAPPEIISTKISDAPLSDSSLPPISISLDQESILQPEPTPISEIGLNLEQGQLQMQASLQSDGEGLKISVEDIPQTHGTSVANVNLEIPTTDSRKHPKSHILTNINVNVNVNGDGKGSAVNSTSVAEITVPIKSGHKKI